MTQTVIGSEPAATSCPGCGTDLIAGQRFVTWCPACDWNVDPAPQRTLSWRRQRSADASLQAARRLFTEVSATGTQKPRTATAGVATAAALVHTITFAMIAVGAALLADGFGIIAPVRFAFGAIAVAVGLYLQPFQPAPRSRRKWAQPMTRDIAPILFGLIDDIAGELGAPGVDSVYFNTRYTASLLERPKTGWTLTLGLGLWSVLSPEERVALIAHEVGHQVNDDRRRTWLARTAADAMGRWSRMLSPRTERPALRILARIAGVVGFVAMLPFSLTARGLGSVLSGLAGRQGQAAEYYADELSAAVAGTDAVHGLLEKSMLAAIYDHELTRAVRFRDPLSPWDELAKFALTIPETERERHRRVGRLRLAAVDATHPPTQLRADVVASAPAAPATVTLDGGRLRAVNSEIEGIEEDATAIMRAALRGQDAFARPALRA
jgi:Zn-dependent protease with chaperone function